MAIDPKHLPDDPKALQQMVLDLMAQLDREFTAAEPGGRWERWYAERLPALVT